MHREDDLIFFDDTDKRDYPALEDKPFVPVEAVPDLFQGILDAQESNIAEIHRLNSHDVHDRSYAEYLADLQQAHVRSIRLQRVATAFGDLAGVELIEAMLPATAV